jgi:hypothetical protein
LPLTFKVTDSSTPTQSATTSVLLTITSLPLSNTTTALPNGIVGSPYSFTLTANGGTLPYNWQLLSGTLPSGLTLNGTTGLISGTPAAAVTATPLTFKVTDSSTPQQNATTPTLTLTIIPLLTITTTALPSGTVNSSYSVTLAATGGMGAYTWSLTSGMLPAGLTLNPSTGTISGTPGAPVTATPLTFKVTDSGTPQQSASISLPLTIASLPLTITTTGLPSGTVGTSYSFGLTAIGGTAPYTWSLIGGRLPAGLALNPATGVISGTPTYSVPGSLLTFQVTDVSSPQQSAMAQFAITIGSTQ